MNTSTTPNTLYRFRSIDALLDKYQELENQTIYFASPDQLNDPMEGFRDIVWSGDRIVWTSFIKNYVYWLLVGYLLFTIIGDSEELDADKIPIPTRWDKPPTPLVLRLFDDIWHEFLNLPNVPKIIEALANSNRKFRYRELEFFLGVIRDAFRVQIRESSLAHELISQSERQRSTEKLFSSQQILELIPILIKLLEKTKTEETIDAGLREMEALGNNERIIQQLNNPIPTGKLGKESQLSFDFPKIYLKKIEKLLWPKWYTACFMKNYHNSSVWGNYGDKHEGACLIFKSVKTGGSNGLELYQETGKSVRVIPFSEISYVEKPGEVDFFRSIGRLTVELLMKLWYTNEEGNISECAAHIPRDGDMDRGDIVGWRKSYWDSFYRDITTKTKDWEYEREYRLILDDRSGEFDEEKGRTLTYDFNSLKGIIFGIKTSDDDKLKIIQIIQRKCKENNRTDFKFYQAYYSPENSDIRKHEIQVDDTLLSG